MRRLYFKPKHRFTKETVGKIEMVDGKPMYIYYTPPEKPKKKRSKIPKVRHYAYPYPDN